jgi:hypothetical protein
MMGPPDHDRAVLIDALWRATDELATSSPSLAEAAALRAQIHDLMGRLGATAPMAAYGAGGDSASALRSVV